MNVVIQLAVLSERHCTVYSYFHVYCWSAH